MGTTPVSSISEIMALCHSITRAKYASLVKLCTSAVIEAKDYAPIGHQITQLILKELFFVKDKGAPL